MGTLLIDSNQERKRGRAETFESDGQTDESDDID